MDTIKRLALVIILFGVSTVIGCLMIAETVSKKMEEKKDLTPDEVVSSFYAKWKNEKDPFSDGFHTFKTDLTEEFRNYLSNFSENSDPVTCAKILSSAFSISPAITEGDKTYVILSNENAKARVELKFLNNRWLIDSVLCEN
ncbi:MAG: hypothetical protein WC519_02010 [Parcubacteria group bacterium]